MKDQLQHATITLQQSYAAPLERVFSEFADPVARARWSPPSGDAFMMRPISVKEAGTDSDAVRKAPRSFVERPFITSSSRTNSSFRARPWRWRVSVLRFRS